MAKATRNDLLLAARFIVALYNVTKGRPGRFRRIDDCARRAGIAGERDTETALRTAERAGFVTVRVDGAEAMLTTEGLRAARKRD